MVLPQTKCLFRNLFQEAPVGGWDSKTEKESLFGVNKQMVNRCIPEGVLLGDSIEHFSEKSQLKSKEDGVFI